MLPSVKIKLIISYGWIDLKLCLLQNWIPFLVIEVEFDLLASKYTNKTQFLFLKGKKNYEGTNIYFGEWKNIYEWLQTSIQHFEIKWKILSCRPIWVHCLSQKLAVSHNLSDKKTIPTPFLEEENAFELQWMNFL